MFKILSYFRKTDGLPKTCPTDSSTKSKVRTERKASPTLSGFINTAAQGVSSSTADNYRTAVRSFVRFNGCKDVPLSALNAETLRCYERWLRKQGVCPNTSSCYIRSLRAIYNKAVGKRVISDKAPFKGVFTGNEPTAKRCIGVEEIHKLNLFSPPHGKEALDFFLFSLYTMGMPFIDMAYLKQSQIKNGVLTYRRCKTGKQIKVTLEPCMLDILAKYKMKGMDYLFPILYKVKSGKTIAVSYSYALNRYNRQLKELAQKAGIKERLTSYVARHSWASIAYENNVDLPIISKALGHANTQTTLVYIEGIKDERLAQANRELLKEYFQTTSYKEV